MSVAYISFSAHVDFLQNSQFIDDIRAPHLVLVHGDSNEMGRLKMALQRKYEESSEKMTIYAPKNCEKVELEFRGQKTTKIIGSAAKSLTESKEEKGKDKIVSGILVGKDFEYQIMAPTDIREHTNLVQASVLQRQLVTVQAPFSLIEYHMLQLFGANQCVRDRNTLFICNAIQLEVEEDLCRVSIEWPGNFVNDLLVDSILTVLLFVETSRASVKATGKSSCGDKHVHADEQRIDHVKSWLMCNYENVEGSMDDGSYSFVVNGQKVAIDSTSLQVICDDLDTSNHVSKAVSELVQAVSPHVIL